MMTAAALGFLMMPSVFASARIGGGHISTRTFRGGGSRFYTGRRVLFFFLPGHQVGGSIIMLLLLAGCVALFVNWRKRKRYERAHPESVVKITPELDAEFSQLYYRVQEDLSTNNQDDLGQVFAANLLRQQAAALNKYAHKNIYNRITDVAIVELEEEPTLRDDLAHVMVTAQKRQYLEYTDKDEAFNKQMCRFVRILLRNGIKQQEFENIMRFKMLETFEQKTFLHSFSVLAVHIYSIIIT